MPFASQKRVALASALLPLLAFGVFLSATRVYAGEIADPYCYYEDKKYSIGSCQDFNCCFWCWDDNQRCQYPFGASMPYWTTCGEGCSY